MSLAQRLRRRQARRYSISPNSLPSIGAWRKPHMPPRLRSVRNMLRRPARRAHVSGLAMGCRTTGRRGGACEWPYLACLHAIKMIGDLHEPLLMRDGQHRELALQMAERFDDIGLR